MSGTQSVMMVQVLPLKCDDNIYKQTAQSKFNISMKLYAETV